MSHFKSQSLSRQRLALTLIFSLLSAFVAPLTLSRAASTMHFEANSSQEVSAPFQTDFIRQISITANDVAYSSATGKLYASVPSSAGSTGNRIATINPVTGNVDNSVFIGSEPNLLAMSDDGNSLYATLDGSFSIRRFDTPTETAGLQFSVGQDSFFGRYRVNDLAVAPGNPNVVAIARQYPGTSPPEAGVAIFDNGVQRPTTGPGHTEGSDYLSFSASATKLYGCGFYSSLKTLTVSASGVTVASTVPFSVGSRIKFNNGLVFSSSGQVVNPDTPALLGTFANTFSTAFVPDSSVSRAYYVVSENNFLTIKAFDINTFLSVGSLVVPGATGNPTNLIRWGTNGLALRTSSGQLFLIQTSLIPSPDPIPTPTPTVSPTPTPSPASFDTFVRQVPLPSNDLIYDQSTQSLYASVPSSAGSIGNSITPINPTTATVGGSVFVGSEPTKLAQADDGQTLYVGLDGAASVRRFNTATQTAGQQFALGFDSFNGAYALSDLAVAPGNPGLVAIARQYRGVSPSEAGVAVFDNGVQRPNTGPGHINGSDLLTFSNSAATLYGVGYSGLSTMTVDVGGITVNNTKPFYSGTSIKFANNLVYSASGQVIDPATGTIVGTFSGLGSGNFSPLMAVDAANNRVFFLTSQSSIAQLRAYDLNTFVPLGSVNILGVTGSSISSLVRWGSNGIAFRTNDRVFLVQSALVNATDPVPAPTPTPSPTPVPTPAYVPTFIRRVNLPANSIVLSQATQAIYASVPSSAGANGNSITKIMPDTGVVGPSVFIGSEPNKLALSDDGNTLYANLDGANSIRRFDVPSLTPGLQFPASSQPPIDMDVMPGAPNTVAVSRGISNGIAIYDNGVQRPNTGSGSYYAVGPIEFGSTAATLYGYDSFSSGFELVKFSVDPSGVSTVNVTNNLLTGYITGLKFSNGLLYSGSGRIADPEARKLVGTLQNVGSPNAIAVDAASGRVFYLYGSGSGVVLLGFDINTFLPLGQVVMPNVAGVPGNLVRWGTNGLAFNTVPGFGSNSSQVYLLQSALVSSTGTIPTGVQLNASTLSTFEGGGNLQVTISRTGDISGPTAVNYATSDGTAKAGSDYTATSGTVTFAAGELTKVITVPIINDTLYEAGNETFGFSLSSPTNGALLTEPSSAVVTISDNDQKPAILMSSTFRASEGNSGTRTFDIPVNLSNPSVEQITVNYTTDTGSASAGSDYVATSGTLTFLPGTTANSVSVTVNGDTVVEPDETFLLKLSNPVNAAGLAGSQLTATIANDDSSFQLAASTYTVAEAVNSFTVSVTRVGDLSLPATVNYSTNDTAGANNCNVVSGKASSRCDYLSAIGTLKFAAGQSLKTIPIAVIDDVYAEGNETFTVDLSSPTLGTLGSLPSTTVTIVEDDTANGTNPIDQANYFVRLHYIDFLNREPDSAGLAFWSNQITECQQIGATCDAEVRRTNVSAAFFLSIEFQETGYLVYRTYKAAYGNISGTPVPLRFNEFLPDTQQIGQGVVVGVGNWQAVLENNKVVFTQDFVARPRFTTAYPMTMTPAEFVDAMFANAGVTPTASDRDLAINEFSATGTTTDNIARARALRRVAENSTLNQQETNKAFVLMQYFGYLRRNPNDPPETGLNFDGYNFWLGKLNQFNGNFVNAEMVKAFIVSGEYRQRFGP